jgi:hypothetical protein
LNIELDAKESFRRMMTFVKQFGQIYIENMKKKLQSSKETPLGLFNGSKSGEYEKTFDYLGYYGINNQKRINKALYPF